MAKLDLRVNVEPICENISIPELARRVEALENPKPVDIKIYRDNLCARLPVRATPGSSGYDLYCTEKIVMKAFSWKIIPTGLKVKIPDGYELQVRPKSGLALKYGLTVLNAPGTIDSDYRGEIGVIISNGRDEDFAFEAFDKIAQIVCCKVSPINFIEVDEDEFNREDTVNNRGAGGFGSTGR